VYVRYWHKADNPAAPAFVRYWTKADKAGFPPEMVCPLMTQSGDEANRFHFDYLVGKSDNHTNKEAARTGGLLRS
jgi:hypothetical protein